MKFSIKGKRSVQKIVMHRFIVYSVGIWLFVAVLEFFVMLLLSQIPSDFVQNVAERAFIPLDEADYPAQISQIVPSIIWVLITALVYLLGIRLFGRSISRKVMEPVWNMVEGFREVTAGNLDVMLEFDTETEFKEMRDNFNLMVQKLRDSEEKRISMENERMQLFSHIAHDLKTPITTISGYAGALAGGMVEESEKQQEYYLAIAAKSEQMNQLIEQLLAYSKMGAPQYQMNCVRVDLVELLRAACASLFGEIEMKQMELELQLPKKPVFYKADSLELTRAVSNLLTNAIRHNPAGILLSVGLTEEPDRVVIEIADSGAVIPESIAGNLFEPFISGDDARSAGSGTGLGLAIVKKVVEQHSGEVYVSAAAIPYTKMFVISLPKQC